MSGFISQWAAKRLAARLPAMDAELQDAKDELARLRRFNRSFGGDNQRILSQEKRVAKIEQRVEKAKAALPNPEGTEGP